MATSAANRIHMVASLGRLAIITRVNAPEVALSQELLTIALLVTALEQLLQPKFKRIKQTDVNF